MRVWVEMLSCSVSRSVEEAAKDPEWPGPPLQNFVQTTLKFVERTRERRGPALEAEGARERERERRRPHAPVKNNNDS